MLDWFRVRPRTAATSSLPPTCWERILAPVLLFIVLVYSLFRLLPWQYKALNSHLDASWIRIIQEGFLHHQAFGRELVFTYGPWGFAVLPFYHPSLFSLQLTIQGLLCLLLMVATWRIGRSVSPRPAVSLGVAALLCFAVIECIAAAYEILYPLLIWHFALDQLGVGKLVSPAVEVTTGSSPAPTSAARWKGRWPTVQRQALVTSAAFLSLTKFSYAAVCLVVIPAIVLRVAIKQRRLPWVLSAYLLQVLFFWWLAGQRTGDLLPYLRNSAEVSAGYAAMALPGPGWQVLGFLLGGGLVLAAIGWEQWCAEKWYAAAAIVSLGMVFFVLTKASFVRHDYWHFLIAGYSLPALCLTTCAILWRRPISQAAKGFAVASCLPALFLAGIATFSQEGADPRTGQMPRVNEDHSRQLTSLVGLLRGTQSLRAEYEKADAHLRELCPIPQGEGTFDVYS